MTNSVSPHQSIANAKPNFINLLKKTSALGERYNNGYGPEDARTEFFTQFSLLNLWLLIQFDSFLDVFAPNGYRVSRYAQFTPQDTIQFMSQYDKINRASYCTEAMFNVEHFLNSVAKPLDIKTDGGYWNVTERLRKKPLNLTEQQFYILNVPAALRNSLHNNGYHKKQGFEVVICGNLYKFVDGEQVKFAGWDNLYIMFDKLLDVIELIIESKRVKQEPKIPHTSMTYHDTQQQIEEDISTKPWALFSPSQSQGFLWDIYDTSPKLTFEDWDNGGDTLVNGQNNSFIQDSP